MSRRFSRFGQFERLNGKCYGMRFAVNCNVSDIITPFYTTIIMIMESLQCAMPFFPLFMTSSISSSSVLFFSFANIVSTSILLCSICWPTLTLKTRPNQNQRVSFNLFGCGLKCRVHPLQRCAHVWLCGTFEYFCV